MDDAKFARCIRLTESENEHEALAALRMAQNLCLKNKINFSDYILQKNNMSHASYEIDYIKSSLTRMTLEKEDLERRYAQLRIENKKLKQKMASTNKNEPTIFDHFTECQKYEKTNHTIGLVQEFIQREKISISGQNWVSVDDLYTRFKKELCYDTVLVSTKKFSQIFASYFKIKPTRGGIKKDQPGFCVFFDSRK